MGTRNGTTYTEPNIIPDTFTTGAAHVGAASEGTVRLTFYVDIELSGGGSEHRINDRVVLPVEAVPALLVMLSDILGLRPEGLAPVGMAKASH